MEYPMCVQTVTVYRKEGGEVARYVVDNCFYHHSLRRRDSHDGIRLERSFTLIIPQGFIPKIGDRVFDGIGPETVDWEHFLPSLVEGLSQVAYATPWYLGDSLSHWEAGRK